LSCSASGIFAICCDLTRPTIMGRARTCPWTRMRPYRVLLRGQGVFFAAQSSADCSICMCEFDFRQAHRLPRTGNPGHGSGRIRPDRTADNPGNSTPEGGSGSTSGDAPIRPRLRRYRAHLFFDFFGVLDLTETPRRIATLRIRSGVRFMAFAISSSVLEALASSITRRSSLKDQPFRISRHSRPLRKAAKGSMIA
jgi:hypothetical protein